MAARYLIPDWPDARTIPAAALCRYRHRIRQRRDPDAARSRHVGPHHGTDRVAIAAGRRLPRAGATLLQRDFCSPGFMAGFNTGTLGIPNLRAHAETLRLIRRIIMNHAALHGRMALPFVRPGDRELRFVSPDARSIPVRSRASSALPVTMRTPAIAAGWCTSGRCRVPPSEPRMRDYLARLRAAYGTDVHPPTARALFCPSAPQSPKPRLSAMEAAPTARQPLRRRVAGGSISRAA